MARLRKPGDGELARLEHKTSPFGRPVRLTLLRDKSLAFERMSLEKPDVTMYFARFSGIKSIRKFAFAILDATGGREES